MRMLSRPTRPLFVGLVVLALSGCYPSLKAPLYYELDMVLDVDGDEMLITHNWHCSFSNDLSESDFRFHEHLDASSAAQSGIVRAIGNDGVLFFPAPGCGERGIGKYSAYITVVRSVTNPATVEHYTPNRYTLDEHTVRVTSMQIRILGSPKGDSAPSPEQIRLIRELDKNSHGFQSIVARIWPETVWSARRYHGLAEYLERQTDFVVAAEKRRRGFAFFPFDDAPSGAEGDTLPYVSLRKRGDVWVMPTRFPNEEAVVAYAVPSQDVVVIDGIHMRPANIDYQGHVFESLNFVQTFDPQRRILIEFDSEYDEKPWAGRLPQPYVQ